GGLAARLDGLAQHGESGVPADDVDARVDGRLLEVRRDRAQHAHAVLVAGFERRDGVALDLGERVVPRRHDLTLTFFVPRSSVMRSSTVPMPITFSMMIGEGSLGTVRTMRPAPSSRRSTTSGISLNQRRSSVL